MSLSWMKNKTLGIYLHIPFCVRKCAYCDFLSHRPESGETELYVSALKREIGALGQTAYDYSADTVFFGGGTPTFLTGEQLSDIMICLRENFDLMPEAEISLEMNPGTDRPDLEEFLKKDVNRVSLGLQSADENELKILGRIHSYEDFLKTYEHLRRLGLGNINVDLMSALPGQTSDSWRRTLKTVSSLSPEHISAYSLIIEEGTPFRQSYERGELALPDEETEREMYAMTESLLGESGYHRYEISNYAKPGYECRHNLRYWTGGSYLGLGLGASSYFEGRRRKNTDDFRLYIEDSGSPAGIRTEEQELSDQDCMEEFMFLGLRLTKGISEKAFSDRFGKSIDEVYGTVLSDHERKDLIFRQAGYIALTPRGVDISNYVLADYLLS